MKFRPLLIAGVMALGFPISANAAVVSIEEFDFDLSQFNGAYVTTNAPTSAFFGAVFDQAAGVDGYVVGELAGKPGGTYAPNDHGDRITLGSNTVQRSLTLNYGPGVAVGAGQASNFVVYEQATANGAVDDEGRWYEISVNGNAWVNASAYPLHLTPISANHQNRVVFDLTSAAFGLSIGDLLTSVSIRNILGSVPNSDPDILFMARAGIVSAVPLPAALPLMAAAFGLLGYVGRRRMRQPA